jgi:hypothetical protein
LSNLLAKMGFSRRTEAAVYAARAKPGQGANQVEALPDGATT